MEQMVKSCTKFMCKAIILISSILFDEVVSLFSFKVFQISIQAGLHQGIKKSGRAPPRFRKMDKSYIIDTYPNDR